MNTLSMIANPDQNFQGFAPKGKGCGKDDWGPYGKGKDGFGKDGMMGKGMGKFGKDGGMMGKGPVDPQNPWKELGWDPNYRPGTYYEEPGGRIGIEGLKDAVTRACEPHIPTETRWSRDEMINKVCVTIFKASNKWSKEDDRHNDAGTAIQAQALLEEFTEKIMSTLSTTLYEKPWFLEIYLSEAVALAAINTFKGGALFKRTVAPIIVTHVDEAIFRVREEERHSVVMWDAVSSVGIKSDYLKKANKNLQNAWEAAHISAKYGSSPAVTPELGMVQDFVQAWITEFVRRAWDTLNNGIPNPTMDQQIGVTTTLFQYLCDPSHSCIPHDLTQQCESPPPAQWDFVAAAVIQLMAAT